MELSVLTFNIKDYIFAPDRRQRMQRLISEVIYHGPDILLLQEVFEPGDGREIADRLDYNAQPNILARRIIPFYSTGGLVTLSRYPIQGSVFTLFESRGKGFIEWLTRKGYTKTNIETPEGHILAVNTHLSAWPENICVRRNQLRQLLEDPEIAESEYPVILGGDFNFNLDIGDIDGGTEELKRLKTADFTDSLDGQKADLKTFCRRNKYVRSSDVDDFGGDCRLDGVFVKPGEKVGVALLNGRPRAKLVGTLTAPASDHFGLEVGIELYRNGIR